jgi:hypothetical protein
MGMGRIDRVDACINCVIQISGRTHNSTFSLYGLFQHLSAQAIRATIASL